MKTNIIAVVGALCAILMSSCTVTRRDQAPGFQQQGLMGGASMVVQQPPFVQQTGFEQPPAPGPQIQEQQEVRSKQTATITDRVNLEQIGLKLGAVVDPTTKRFRRDDKGLITHEVFEAIMAGGTIEWNSGSFGLPKRVEEVTGVTDRISTEDVVQHCLVHRHIPHPKKPDAPAHLPDIGLMVRSRLQSYGVAFQQ